MTTKQLRILIALGFGGVALFYFLRNHAAAKALANPTGIQPIAPQNLAPITLPGPNPTGAPPLRGAYTQ